MDKLTKENVRALHTDMKQAMSKVATDNDVIIDKKRSVFDNTTGIFSFFVKLRNPGNGILSTEQLEYDSRVERCGLPIRDSVVMASSGKKYKVKGFNVRAHKYPIILEDLDTNFEYKVAIDFVKKCTYI